MAGALSADLASLVNKIDEIDDGAPSTRVTSATRRLRWGREGWMGMRRPSGGGRGLGAHVPGRAQPERAVRLMRVGCVLDLLHASDDLGQSAAKQRASSAP